VKDLLSGFRACAGRRRPSLTATRRRTGRGASACAGRRRPLWTVTRRASRTATSASSAGVSHGASRVASLGAIRTVRGRRRGELTRWCASVCAGRRRPSWTVVRRASRTATSASSMGSAHGASRVALWLSGGIDSGESSSSTYATPLVSMALVRVQGVVAHHGL
jgi:hypothetical protein